MFGVVHLGRLAIVACAGIIACGTEEAPPSAALPDFDTTAFATGPHARAHAVMERTILGIDVLAVDLWLGHEPSARIEEILRGREYSSELADSVAPALVGTRDGLARARVEFGISLDRFLESTGQNLDRAVEAGLMSAAMAREVGSYLPAWFEFLSERGLEEGDLMFSRIRGDTVRTVYHTAEGATLLDQTDPHGVERWISTLASYLAPESGLREDLIRSLFADE